MEAEYSSVNESSATMTPTFSAQPGGRDGAGRYYNLDALRAFALMAVVIGHAAMSFRSQNTWWATVDCSPSNFLVWCQFGLHSFRLELFFVIAGFFARLILVRQGVRGFISNRVKRILVPFLAGWIALYPLVMLVWLWGWTVSHRLDELGLPPGAQYLPVWKLCLTYMQTLPNFGMIHLWFLYQLLIIYALVLTIRWLTGKFKITLSILASMDGGFADLGSWPLALVSFSLWSFPCLYMMASWTTDTPTRTLIPCLPTTLIFGLCFSVGWFLHRQQTVLNQWKQHWTWPLGIGLFLWVLFGIFGKYDSSQLSPQQLGVTSGEMIWVHLVYMAIYATMMWGLTLGLLGLFARLFQRQNLWVRYVADASYWIYLIHFPLVMALQVAVSRMNQPWPIKFMFISMATLLLAFLGYHYLVRNTFIGVQLNGRRYPRTWPWQASSERQ